MLHRLEAEQLNKSLPSKFKYVPANELPDVEGEGLEGGGARSTRAARAAARSAMEEEEAPEISAGEVDSDARLLRTRRQKP